MLIGPPRPTLVTWCKPIGLQFIFGPIWLASLFCSEFVRMSVWFYAIKRELL